DPRQAFTGNAIGTAYSGSITLNETKQVKARIKNGSYWSALNEAVFSDDRLANSLRITEVMYHPVDSNDEYIEFKNIGPATINLAHCQLTQGVDFTFPSITLAPNAYTIVVRDTAEFNARYPGYSGTIAGEYTNDKLDNGGENIRLKDAAGNIIQEFEYEDNWFPITDGLGYSLNIINPADTVLDNWNKRLSWEASNVLGGTPGADHIANAVGNADIVINEILTHTDDSQGDWIELYNASGGSIDVNGWYLSDNKDNLKKYRITSPTVSTVIPAGGYLVLTAATHFQNAADPGSAVQFGLSEHGEDIFLTSGNGSDIAGGYSDGESFGSSKKDVTFGRYTKGTPTYNTDFIELISMTEGASNSAPYVPDVVITEIMYNAQGIEDQLGEYIELHNRDTGTLYFYDPSNPDNTWKFTKAIDFEFPTGVSIGAGQKILISRTHPDAFKVANGDPGVPVYGPFASGTELENDGEKIELSMPTDPDPGTGFFSYIRVEQVNYSDGIHPLGNDPWPTSADGRGDSLKRKVNSDYANDVANWEAAAPSPGS
ncbi:MAG: lamin tail domain-containing protein, partial [Planctomycetota bacterium]